MLDGSSRLYGTLGFSFLDHQGQCLARTDFAWLGRKGGTNRGVHQPILRPSVIQAPPMIGPN